MTRYDLTFNGNAAGSYDDFATLKNEIKSRITGIGVFEFGWIKNTTMYRVYVDNNLIGEYPTLENAIITAQDRINLIDDASGAITVEITETTTQS